MLTPIEVLWTVGSTIVLLYLICAVATFVYSTIDADAAPGPGLSILRAIVWPYYWATGKPQNEVNG